MVEFLYTTEYDVANIYESEKVEVLLKTYDRGYADELNVFL